MHDEHRLARFDPIADADADRDADRGVDRVSGRPASAAERDHGVGDLFAVDRGDVSRYRCFDHRLGGERERSLETSPLGSDHFVKASHCGSRIDRLFGPIAGLVDGRIDRHFGQQHGGQFDTHRADFGGALSVEQLDRLVDLDRVADRASQRLVHVGDPRGDREPGLVADAAK